MPTDSGYYQHERSESISPEEKPCDRCGKWKWADDLFDGSKWIKGNSAFFLRPEICKACKDHFEEQDKAEAEQLEFERKEKQFSALAYVFNANKLMISLTDNN